jgi:hypothetical protein
MCSLYRYIVLALLKREMKDGTGSDLSLRKLKASAVSLGIERQIASSMPIPSGLVARDGSDTRNGLPRARFAPSYRLYRPRPQATVYLPSEPARSRVTWQRSGTTIP